MESSKIVSKLKDNVDYHVQDQKHQINTELIGIIKFRQNKNG